MYYHCPDTGGSAYVLWRRFIIGRKTGIARIRLWRRKKCGDAGKDMVFRTCCKIGDLSFIRLLVQSEWDPTVDTNNNLAIQLASSYGHLHVVKWLASVGCDPTAGDNWPIQWACENGHLRVVKWLYKMGCDNYAIRWASARGHPRVVKWLYKIGCDPTAADNYAIRWASERGYQQVVDFLVSVGCPDPRT